MTQDDVTRKNYKPRIKFDVKNSYERLSGMLTMATRGIGFTLVVTYALPILLLVERSTGGKIRILLLLVINHLFATHYTECRFEYRKQPPSYAQSTEQSTLGEMCTPYMPHTTSNAKIKISLECVVRRQPGVNDSFEIRWFRENSPNGEVVDLGRGDPDMAQGNDWLSRYHDENLFDWPYDSSFAGKYWCQVVINKTADPDQQLLMGSNVFTLLPPESYTRPHCSQSQVIDNVTCADLPMTDQSDQTSKPVPDTTISSTPQAVIIVSTTTQQTTTRDTTSIWTRNVTSFVSSPSTTPLTVSSPDQQTLLAVVASVGGVLLIMAIILVVVIAVMLTMKKKTVSQTDQKGRVVHILDVINPLITLLPSDNIITTCQYVHQLHVVVVLL